MTRSNRFRTLEKVKEGTLGSAFRSGADAQAASLIEEEHFAGDFVHLFALMQL